MPVSGSSHQYLKEKARAAEKVQARFSSDFASSKEITNEKQTSNPDRGKLKTSKKTDTKEKSKHHTVKKDTDTDVRVADRAQEARKFRIEHYGMFRRSKRDGLLWPGHNYMGPGNPLENGETTTNADKVAREHNHAYAHAWSHDDIKAADEKARSQFLEHPFEISSLVGYAGLSVKSYAEKVFGPLYPSPSDIEQRLPSRAIMVSHRKRREYGTPY